MKLANVITLIVFLLGTIFSASALANGSYRYHGSYGHGYHNNFRLGVFVGPGFFYGSPYYYPPYYPPRVVVAPPPDPVYYTERSDQTLPSSAPGYWYYCGDSKAYYPYVKECPGGWQQVAPQPAN